MKNKLKELKGPLMVLLSCFIAVLIVTALFFLYIFDSEKATQFSSDITLFGWERYVTYPMLSPELKSVISKEEFSDETDEGRLKMYRKLENLVLDERPKDKFDGSTSWWKFPCMEIIETDGERYYVDFGIDVTCAFGVVNVRNFTCHIDEEKL